LIPCKWRWCWAFFERASLWVLLRSCEASTSLDRADADSVCVCVCARRRCETRTRKKRISFFMIVRKLLTFWVAVTTQVRANQQTYDEVARSMSVSPKCAQVDYSSVGSVYLVIHHGTRSAIHNYCSRLLVCLLFNNSMHLLSYTQGLYVPIQWWTARWPFCRPRPPLGPTRY